MTTASIGRREAVELSRWQLPAEVRLERGALWWRGHAADQTLGANQTKVLGRFARLASGSDDDIAAFARQWGVLELCGHAVPSSHRSSVEGSVINGRVMPLRSCRRKPTTRDGWTREPLSRWRGYAAQAVAMLQIAEGLRLGRRTQPSTWEALQELFVLDPIVGGRDVLQPDMAGWRLIAPEDLPETGTIVGMRMTYPSTEGAALAHAVRRWLEIGGVRVHFDWHGDRGRLSFGGHSLFGALATLLSVGVSGSALLICDECHLPYTPLQRRPPARTRHFCADCRDDGAPQRHASADYRARKRSHPS